MKANHFNQYFSNLAVSLNSNALPPIHRQEIPKIALNSESIFFNPTNEYEVLQIILNLKQKTGSNDGMLHSCFCVTIGCTIHCPCAYTY